MAVRAVVLFAGLARGRVRRRTGVVRPLLSAVNGFYAARKIEEVDPRFKNSLHQLPGPPPPQRRDPPGDPPGPGGAGRRRPGRGRGRRGGRPATADPVVLRPGRRGGGLLPLCAADAEERARLGQAGHARRRRPADQHPAGQHQAGRRRGAVPGRLRLRRALLRRGRHPGHPPRRDPAALQRRRRRVLRRPGWRGGARATTPGSVTLRDVQQDIDYYLSANDFRSRRYASTVLPAPVVDAGDARPGLPRLHRRPPPAEGRGGQRPGPGRDARHDPGPDQPAGPRAATWTSARSARRRCWSSPDDRPRADRPVQGRAERLVHDQVHHDRGEDTTPSPVVYDIEALPDRRPEVHFLRRAGDRPGPGQRDGRPGAGGLRRLRPRVGRAPPPPRRRGPSAGDRLPRWPGPPPDRSSRPRSSTWPP